MTTHAMIVARLTIALAVVACMPVSAQSSITARATKPTTAARVSAAAPAKAAPPAPAASATATTGHEDRADLERTAIVGQRELPKVLYIVPWKKPIPGDLSGKPVSGVLDEALAPVDREVLRRQMAFDDATRERAEAARRAR